MSTYTLRSLNKCIRLKSGWNPAAWWGYVFDWIFTERFIVLNTTYRYYNHQDGMVIGYRFWNIIEQEIVEL
ncbi:MAG: hypothetical protein SCH70_03415 [Candidatus Methanoperedens sp.]|nr:hypothetical protein [Candidatus Methanoperedens sp.]